MKTIIYLFVIFNIISCSNTDQINKICYSVYEFPSCVTKITVSDNDPMLCDDIQIRFYTNDYTYTQWYDYYVKDSTVFITNSENIKYQKGELYLIYFNKD